MLMRVPAINVYYLVSALHEFTSEFPYLSYFLFRNLGLGYTFLYAAISTLVFGVFDYPTGGLADRFGRRRVYAFGFALLGLNYLLVALFAYPFTVALAGILLGFGRALQSGSLEAWITDELGEMKMTEELDLVFGRGTSFGLIGDVSAGLAGSIVTYVYGYWWTIPIAGILALVTSCLTIALVSENWGKDKGKKYVELLKEGGKLISSKKSLLFLGLAQALFMTGLCSYWEILTPVYGERGIPESLFGLIGAAMHLPAVIATGYVHRLTRKIGVAKTALVTSWIWTGFCTSVMFLVDPNVTIALVITLETVFATRYPILSFWQNKLIPSKVRATVLSGLSTMQQFAQSLVLFALSPFVQTQGTMWGFASAVILTVISNLLLLFVRENNQLRSIDRVCNVSDSAVYD